MLISQKSQYALKAVFELAWRNSDSPAKIHTIAEAQGIPARFLEVILNELRHAGFAESRRGKAGGYTLAVEPGSITVGDIIRCIQGPLHVATNNNGKNGEQPKGATAFTVLLDNVGEAVKEVYNNTTFAQLIEQEKQMTEKYVPNYTI